jgi:hypothetical protein
VARPPIHTECHPPLSIPIHLEKFVSAIQLRGIWGPWSQSLSKEMPRYERWSLRTMTVQIPQLAEQDVPLGLRCVVDRHVRSERQVFCGTRNHREGLLKSISTVVDDRCKIRLSVLWESKPASNTTIVYRVCRVRLSCFCGPSDQVRSPESKCLDLQITVSMLRMCKRSRS